MPKKISRRSLLERTILAHFCSILVGRAGTASAANKVCADPKQMDSGQASIRESLNYTETSPDPATTCSVCGLFEATSEGCGMCAIFNGPANAKGHCDSWSAKD